jgi:hypothetical protein
MGEEPVQPTACLRGADVALIGIRGPSARICLRIHGDEEPSKQDARPGGGGYDVTIHNERGTLIISACCSRSRLGKPVTDVEYRANSCQAVP